MRLLLCVVVSAVFLGLNYLLNINEEQIVLTKIENSRENLSFSEDFIRDLASLKNSRLSLPESALVLPDFIIDKPLVTKSLTQVDGEVFNLELKIQLNRISDQLVQVVGDKKDDLIFFVEKNINPSFPVELINLRTKEKLLVQMDLPKVPAKKLVKETVSLTSSAIKKEVKKGVRAFEGELQIYQAIIPKFSRAPLRGSMVSGAISVNAGSLESLDIEVTNQNGDIKELSFNYSEIKDGGVFSFEDNGSEAFGILTNDGDNGLRVRFSTGRFAGAVVSFGEGINSGSPRLPKEEVIKLNEQARSDFKRRALSNEYVKESQVRL